jgi:hypothetical protein
MRCGKSGAFRSTDPRRQLGSMSIVTILRNELGERFAYEFFTTILLFAKAANGGRKCAFFLDRCDRAIMNLL